VIENLEASNDKILWDDLDSYRGMDNVFLVEWDFTVNNGDLMGLDHPTTYVVNGNLIINDNIESDQNIAFVVKGSKITVQWDVTKLHGTYIALNGNIGWVEAPASEESQQLVVDGSLYGNVNELVNSRTYVKQVEGEKISVWTVVNFGSSIFKKPAPLVGQFVSEYLASNKVAR